MPTHKNNMEKQWQQKCRVQLLKADWLKKADLSCRDEVPSAVRAAEALF